MCLTVVCIFNDTLNSSEYTVLIGLLCNELNRVLQKLLWPSSRVGLLYQNFPAGTEEKNESFFFRIIGVAAEICYRICKLCVRVCVNCVHTRSCVSPFVIFFTSPWRYTNHSGCVIYSPLSGLSLLAYEVT